MKQHLIYSHKLSVEESAIMMKEVPKQILMPDFQNLLDCKVLTPTIQYPIEIIVADLITYMRGIEGGSLQKSSIKTVVSQIRGIIMQGLDKDFFCIENFTKDFVRDYLFDNQPKQVQELMPNSRRTLLNSMKVFARFLMADERFKDFKVAMSDIIFSLSSWAKSQKKNITEQFIFNAERDCGRLITIEDMKKFRESEMVKKCKDIIMQQKVGMKEYILARNYAIFLCCAPRATRPMAIKELTLKEFRDAVWSNETHAIIRVGHHKTRTAHGTQPIPLIKWQYDFIKDFIEYRNSFLGMLKRKGKLIHGDIKHVFVSSHGQKLSSSAILKSVQSIWEGAGLKTDITVNLMRKTNVTNIHEQRKDVAEDLAALMTHKVETARNFYDVSNRVGASYRATRALEELYGEEDEEWPPRNKDMKDINVDLEIHADNDAIVYDDGDSNAICNPTMREDEFELLNIAGPSSIASDDMFDPVDELTQRDGFVGSSDDADIVSDESDFDFESDQEDYDDLLNTPSCSTSRAPISPHNLPKGKGKGKNNKKLVGRGRPSLFDSPTKKELKSVFRPFIEQHRPIVDGNLKKFLKRCSPKMRSISLTSIKRRIRYERLQLSRPD